MKKYLLFSCFITTICFAQTKQIRGFVFSQQDSLPLAFVNIYNEEYRFGTVSNELGEYLLNYPDTISSFNLTISSLGYLTKIIPNKSIVDTIYLFESTIELDEVLITNTNNDIKYTLKKVFDNLKNNYNNKRHLLKGFYREAAIKSKDSSYLRIIEADVDIQEYGILKALDRDRIQINHLRKSDDKITKKWYMNVAENMFGKKNSLVWLNKQDFVKNFVKFKDYHSHYDNIMNNFHFEFAEYQKFNNSLVAVYSYFDKQYINANLKNEDKNLLYINMDDFAIIKVKQQTIIGPTNAYKKLGVIEYHYTKIGDFYYLNSARNVSFLSGKGSEKELKTEYLYVYQVHTNRNQYDKIKRKEAISINEDLYENNIKIDTVFWNNYKVLSEIPLNQKLKILIQKEKTLENQFLDNGKN